MQESIKVQPDYEGAIKYALDRLRTGLHEIYTYHCFAHTAEDVLQAVKRLSVRAELPANEARLIEVAAAFHDVGYVQSNVNHEGIGIDIVKGVLPNYGFSQSEIKAVASMISATRMPQSPTNYNEEILADADLDSLGRDDFMETSRALWLEYEALGSSRSWREWLQFQVIFLQNHRYFTDVARSLRDVGKQRNITKLQKMLREL